MTKEKKKDTPAKNTKTSTSKKITLYDAVEQSKERKYIVVGALSRAGLLEKYRYEESIYGIEDIEPSITENDFNKIIKEFLGEMK